MAEKIKPEKVVAKKMEDLFSNPIVEEKVKDEFKNWGSIGGREGIAGYKIIKGPRGHRIDELSEIEYMIIDRPYDIMYHHSYGLVSKFFRGLKEKKIYGTKCPKCGDVFCAPRAHCWNPECRLQETEWIELPHTGTLHSYTILGFSAEAFLPMLPFILGYVRIDGANTMLTMVVKEVEPEEIECDTKVEIRFVDKPKGSPMDMYAVPLEKLESKRTQEEKERLKKQLEPTREWVRKRFGR